MRDAAKEGVIVDMDPLRVILDAQGADFQEPRGAFVGFRAAWCTLALPGPPAYCSQGGGRGGQEVDIGNQNSLAKHMIIRRATHFAGRFVSFFEVHFLR